MILDKIENSNYYWNLHPLFEKAFEFVKDYLGKPMKPGVYQICGDDLFVKIQEFDTRDEGFLEVHDKYIDIQCMIEGEEKVYYAQREKLEPKFPYDEKEDALFLKDAENMMEFIFKAGEFVIFYSQDAHKPSMVIEEKARAKKLVFKVRSLIEE